ncbi:MAG TPA: aldose 1-epimerase, partial [Solirubrobacteraceae bacterium]
MAATPDAPLAALELGSGDGELVARFTPHAGMVGCSLRHRGEELLAPGGIPILHPWANRLSDWGYEVAGRRVVLDRRSPLLRSDDNGLPIHGALHESALWQAHSDGDGALRAELDYGAHDDLLAAFPFRHGLELSVRLRGPTLAVTTTVTATGGAPVPLSFGFHPWFRLPGVPRAEWEVELPDRHELVLDRLQLPTGQTIRRPAERGPLGERTFDDLFRPLDVPARFALAGGGRRIVVEMGSGYPYAQVYAPPDADVVCLEPMTAPVNALTTGSGLRFVAPFARASA